MDELQILRSEIERLDKDLLDILASRFEVAKMIGEIKKKSGVPIEDPVRLKEREEGFLAWAEENQLDQELIRKIWQLLQEESRKLQSNT